MKSKKYSIIAIVFAGIYFLIGLMNIIGGIGCKGEGCTLSAVIFIFPFIFPWAIVTSSFLTAVEYYFHLNLAGKPLIDFFVLFPPLLINTVIVCVVTDVLYKMISKLFSHADK